MLSTDYNVIIHTPALKDWNEVLINRVKEGNV